MRTPFHRLFLFCLITATIATYAQEILPPVLPWHGASESLIVPGTHEWVTVAEKSNFEKTSSYDETIAWFQKLCTITPYVKMHSIGKTAQNRDIYIIIGSTENAFDEAALRRSTKPLLFAQAGIHAGEIDGKDAGMMLFRDIATGKKKNLLDGVNFLFIPILNADGHERISPYNRVNQRGPLNMGWRTNARNLNLNRDYTKLDTEEIKAVVSVMNLYDPDLYLDLHVTDGADYQYDITYGFSTAYSPATGQWLTQSLAPIVDNHLKAKGHIPGPLVFASNGRDFTEGMIEFPYSGRFSNNYGDIRHLPSILVENHSLKPFKQRVLGTYVFLEAVIDALTKDGKSLIKAIASDKHRYAADVTLTWKLSKQPETIEFLGVESKLQKSEVTGQDYVQWIGKPVKQTIPVTRFNAPDVVAKRPRAYWVPSTYKNVIERLQLHGIQMEHINEKREVQGEMYKIVDPHFSSQPFEGHVSVTAKTTSVQRKEIFYPGSVRIPTEQPLSDLIVYLLEPESPDSFLQWNFFPEIFNRTEYIEEYAIEPLARKMLSADPSLKKAFDDKKKADTAFAKSPLAMYEWFYERSPYVDDHYLIYPVLLER